MGINVDETPNWKALARILVIRMMRVLSEMFAGAIDRHTGPSNRVHAGLDALKDIRVSRRSTVGANGPEARADAIDRAICVIVCEASQLYLGAICARDAG